MTRAAKPQIAGVISSRADFDRILRLRNPPDLFELRLDCFAPTNDALGRRIKRLGARLIVTARHPGEGGANRLSPRKRRELLLSFLPEATWVDIELRSAAAMAPVFQVARENRVRTILSMHDFGRMLAPGRLDELAHQAESLGADLFKVAVRTDTPAQLETLFEFFERHRSSGKVVAMGIGKLGRRSRLELARRGCPLNYAHLGVPRVAGQLSLAELRQALR